MSIAQEFPQAGLVENMTTGELTINSASQSITIQHNLGKRPDVIILFGNYTSANSIPYGCCVRCVYYKDPFTTPNWIENQMTYMYEYRHSTSGNVLRDMYINPSSQITETTAICPRGASNWAAVDANGNPVTYIWCAIKFKEYFE